MKRKPLDPREQRREQARRAALNALARARRAALRAGVELCDWEGDFWVPWNSGSRLGRAFGDPEKGAPGQALSFRQGRKLKEIAPRRARSPHRRRSRMERDPERDRLSGRVARFAGSARAFPARG